MSVLWKSLVNLCWHSQTLTTIALRGGNRKMSFLTVVDNLTQVLHKEIHNPTLND